MNGIPARVRTIVEKRSQGRCEGCGVYATTELHHRRYRSRGGQHDAANLIALCGWGNHTGCHGFAHTTEQATRMGWSVNSWHDPAAIPFDGWDGIWLLHPDGTRDQLRYDEAAELRALHGMEA